MGCDDRIEGEVPLYEGAGLLPGRACAHGGGQHQRQTTLAWPQLGRCCRHEGCAQSGRSRSLPGLSLLLEAARQLVLQLPPFGLLQTAKQQVASDGASEGRVHDDQVEIGKPGGYPFFDASRASTRHPFGISGGHSDIIAGQRKLDRGLVGTQEVERAQIYLGGFRTQRHDVEVHPVEPNVRVEHRQAGGGKVHSRELDVIPVQGLLHHRLVQLGCVPAASVRMPALGLGGDRHEQRSCATGYVGHVEGSGELVVCPVDVGRPFVENEPGQHGGRGHRGVVGAGELGVGQQGVEEPPREVVTLQAAGVFHRLDEGSYRRGLYFVRPINQNIENVGGQLEHWNVVDVLADRAPGVAEAGNAPAQGFVDGWGVFICGGETVLEGEGIE